MSNVSPHPRILFLSDMTWLKERMGSSPWHRTRALGMASTVTLFGPGHADYRPQMPLADVVRLMYGEQQPDILVHDVPRGRWLVEDLESLDIPKGVVLIDSWRERQTLLDSFRRVGFDFVLPAYMPDVYRLPQEIAGLQAFWFPHAVDTSVFHDAGQSRPLDILLYGWVDEHYPLRARLAHLLARQSEFSFEQIPHPGYWDIGFTRPAEYWTESRLAQRINTAKIAIATTRRECADALFAKYLEIAACGALVAGDIPESAHSLLANGCLEIRSDDSDEAILAKFRHCLAEPARLATLAQQTRDRVIASCSTDRRRADFLEIANRIHVNHQTHVKPRRVKLVIGALSAQAYEQRRQACLSTWADVNERDNVDLVFIVGGGTGAVPTREGHVLRCPCPDDYLSLPQKTRWFCLWALMNYDFEYLFKCDDDTYVDVDRLLHCGVAGDYVGYDIAGFASGGAGYLLSPRAATNVVARMLESTGPEDVLVQKALAQAGMEFTPDSRFYAWNDRAPRSDNDLITSHYCGPDLMPTVHQATLASHCRERQYAQRIPKVFHQVWLGGNPLPTKFRRFQQTWTRHHPTWEFRFWTETNLFRLTNQEDFDRAVPLAQKADIARYEILERFGGVYLDADFECLQSIEPLLKGIEGFAAEEDGDTVGTAILGMVPNHPLLQDVIRSIPIAMAQGGKVCETTGPQLFTRLARGRNDVHVFGREFFYPVHYTGMIWNPVSEAYALHHWAHSWR
jgi:mannosyltransferase OCH1-like enzyme